MSKVYVVIDGYYSDQEIIGVFETKREAEMCATTYGDGHIEEYEIGKIIIEDDKKIGYFLEFYKGRVYIERYFLPNVKNKIVPNKVNKGYAYGGRTPTYTVGVMALSEEQAIKIGSDLVAQFKAEEENL